jgi:hypothetical protein
MLFLSKIAKFFKVGSFLLKLPKLLLILAAGFCLMWVSGHFVYKHFGIMPMLVSFLFFYMGWTASSAVATVQDLHAQSTDESKKD